MKEKLRVDVVIIGAGVIGTAVASYLAKYDLKVCVLEKTNDISNGASKANSGIVHGGYDASPGTLMAKFNVEGNAMYPDLCKRLDVPYQPIGSLVIAFNDEDINTLEKLKERGEINGVPGLEILSADAVLEKEPNLNNDIKGALFSPTAAVVSPYELSIAFMEHAMDNGAELFLENPVQDIEKTTLGYIIQTTEYEIDSTVVINCAGAYADKIHNMVLDLEFEIKARRGEYFLMDKYAGDHVKHVIFQCPNDLGKGILIAPTAHENLIVGPNAQDIDDPEAVETTAQGLGEVWKTALKSAPGLPKDQVITTFSGVRSEPSTGDFIIQDYDKAPGFIDVAGIKSPGLTAAPAIGKYVAELTGKHIGLKEKDDYKHHRRRIVRFHELSHDQKAQKIKEDPMYGRIICRCEGVTEAEIVDSIRRNAGARSLDGVKRRTRSGGGRCQGGFCAPRIMEILSRELDIPIEEVCKDSSVSQIIVEETKGGSR